MKDDIASIKASVEVLKSSPGEKWNKVIMTVVTAAVGFLMAKM